MKVAITGANGFVGWHLRGPEASLMMRVHPTLADDEMGKAVRVLGDVLARASRRRGAQSAMLIWSSE